MSRKFFLGLNFFAVVLALTVVVLGAYVRLSNAGLGCPDWPGCYGRLAVPEAAHVEQHYPGASFEPHKAKKEMVHRYLAGTLGLTILGLALFSLKERRSLIPWILVGLVIFQASLGRWTVTLKLNPFVVMAHLLGGLLTLSLLWWNYLQTKTKRKMPLPSNSFRPWVVGGLVLLALQIVLGGWMSANYASLACPDFPTCQGHWWPPFHLGEAFAVWRETGINYEGGVLGNEARMTIHMMHRVGALVVFLYLGVMGLKALKSPTLRKAGGFLLLFLGTQTALGISNVVFHLPLPVATAHNAVAALLLLTLVGLLHRTKPLAASEAGC